MSSSEVAAPVMARSLRLLAALSLAAVLGACSTGKGALEAPAQADASPGAQALKKLPRKAGERVAVTIYEFRSELPKTLVGKVAYTVLEKEEQEKQAI